MASSKFINRNKAIIKKNMKNRQFHLSFLYAGNMKSGKFAVVKRTSM